MSICIKSYVYSGVGNYVLLITNLIPLQEFGYINTHTHICICICNSYFHFCSKFYFISLCSLLLFTFYKFVVFPTEEVAFCVPL